MCCICVWRKPRNYWAAQCWGVSEIAERVGIPDPSYLSRLFGSRFGITPGAYRRRLHQQEAAGAAGREEL
ncbi:helix-turn-helix domain-containing protein [Paenibacillus rhizoplanae]